MRRFFMLAAALPLMACMVDATPVAQTGDSCGAAGLQDLVGQPETVLARLNFAGTVRIIHPTDRVTMDMRSDRLNFDIDANGVIVRVHCG